MEKKYQCKNIVASGHTANNLSRQNLLQWIEEELGVKVRKVEALCSGAVYCRFMDKLFPGCIPLKKIKLDASVKHEYWSNFKLLQMAFRAVACEKNVPIDRLVEGRFQENFEFLQWFKRFYDANSEMSELTGMKSEVKRTPSSARFTPKAGSSRLVAVVNPVMNRTETEKELKSQIAEYQGRAETIVQEKDFCFNKLRNIELLCVAEEAPKMDKKDLVTKILAELYATGEESQASGDEE